MNIKYLLNSIKKKKEKKANFCLILLGIWKEKGKVFRLKRTNQHFNMFI